nr:ribonuclease H-like domain-containing protein [Tanacetum cinerariifolium]
CLLVKLRLEGVLMLLESILIIEAILVSHLVYGLEGVWDCVLEDNIRLLRLQNPKWLANHLKGDYCFKKLVLEAPAFVEQETEQQILVTGIKYADIFTNELPSALFEDFRSGLSVRLSPAQTARAY